MHRGVAGHVVMRCRQATVGGLVQERVHLIDLRSLCAVDIASEADELFSVTPGGHQCGHVQGLLVMHDHVGQEHQVVLGIERRGGLRGRRRRLVVMLLTQRVVRDQAHQHHAQPRHT